MGKHEIGGFRPVSRSDDQAMPNRSAELTVGSCTLRDVARLAGVSTATVSRVLNSSETVTGKTRERVMLAIAGLQYCPSPHASELGRQNRGIPRKRPQIIDVRRARATKSVQLQKPNHKGRLQGRTTWMFSSMKTDDSELSLLTLNLDLEKLNHD
jgi:hypothetical protein